MVFYFPTLDPQLLEAFLTHLQFFFIGFFFLATMFLLTVQFPQKKSLSPS